MIRHTAPVAVLLALLAGTSSAVAENLLDVYRLAQVEDRQLRAAAAELEAVREVIPQARSEYLPNIFLGADVARNYSNPENFPSDSFNGNSYSLSLLQPVFDRAAWLRQGQASNRAKQAEVSYTFEEQNLIVRASRLYFNVLNSVVDLQAVRADKEATARQLDQTKQRFEVGLIAITDVHEAQARFDRVVTEEIVTQNELDSARESLRVITGQSVGELAELDEEVPLVRPEPDDMERWVAQAYEGNLTLLAAQFGVNVASDEIEVRRSDHYPTVDLFARYGDNNTKSTFNSDLETGAIGLELNLPIYTGGLVSSRTREAESRLVEANELYEQQRRFVGQQTRDAFRTVIASISAVSALQQTVVSNQSALDATQAGFEVGTRTIVDVLDAQRDLFQAKRDYDVARHAYVLSNVSLKQAVGTLNLADVEKATQLLK